MRRGAQVLAARDDARAFACEAFASILDGMNQEKPPEAPLVAVVMGSQSDWKTMRLAAQVLEEFGVAHVCRVLSAHRTPLAMSEFALNARESGLEVIIAGAGGAAHLPGMIAAHTSVPVLGVPVQSKALSGMDSLLSIVQMPAGIPVGTLAIGNAGATNAALLAIAILANTRPGLRDKLDEFRARQSEKVVANPVPGIQN